MTNLIEVWHFTSEDLMLRDDADMILAAWLDKLFVKVAECATTDLEIAWRVTNNIDSSWSRDPHPMVEVTAPLPADRCGRTLGHRSSMVGDVFVKDGKPFYVATVGFKALG